MIPVGMAKGLASKEVRVVGNGGCSKMFGGDGEGCAEGCFGVGCCSGLLNYKGRKSLVAFIQWLIELERFYRSQCIKYLF